MKSCFIIMPISTPTDSVQRYGGDLEHFQNVQDHLHRPALERCGFQPISPSASGSSVIHAEIVKNVLQCDMVLCDMSGLNPNVFFELGIRTAANKPVILVIDKQTAIPFDKQVVNAHIYDSSLRIGTVDQEIARLSSHIQSTCSADIGSNSFWKLFSASVDHHRQKSAQHLMADWLAGWWWEPVFDGRERSLSFTEVVVVPELGTVRLGGTVYKSGGKLFAYWRTQATCLNPETRELFYYWQGHHFDDPSATVGGIAEVMYEGSSEKALRGNGFFSACNLGDFTQNRKNAKWGLRASEIEIATMNGGIHDSVRQLVTDKLRAFAGELAEPSAAADGMGM